MEHHNNNSFDCTIDNLSFAHRDLNIAKAHTYDKNQPKLTRHVGVNFFKDFSSRQYQITMIFTDEFYLVINGTRIFVDRMYLLYDDNFRMIYTDANRIVDELLENKKIDFKVLSFKKLLFSEATFYKPNVEEKITGIRFIQNDLGKTVMMVGEDMKNKIFFDSTSPNKNLYKK